MKHIILRLRIVYTMNCGSKGLAGKNLGLITAILDCYIDQSPYLRSPSICTYLLSPNLGLLSCI
jgi:hypothetical protein